MNIITLGSDFNSPHFDTDENRKNSNSLDADGDEKKINNRYQKRNIEIDDFENNIIEKSEFKANKLSKIKPDDLNNTIQTIDVRC